MCADGWVLTRRLFFNNLEEAQQVVCLQRTAQVLADGVVDDTGCDCIHSSRSLKNVCGNTHAYTQTDERHKREYSVFL